MDHALYPFAPITNRPALPLDGKRMAVYVVLQLEYWELLAPEDSYRDPRFKGEFGTFFPEYRSWTMREYGNRVGAYRVLDALDAAGIAPTVALGAALAQTHPGLVGEVLRRGWEIAAHGYTANRMITSRMSEAEERDFIATSREIVTRAAGAAPAGWLGQDYGTTPRTPGLLRDLGFAYSLDWANDDLPYLQLAGRADGGLVALPAPCDFDDVQTLGLRRVPPDQMVGMLREALDAMTAATTQSVLAIGVHPWMLGAPHRIRYLREMLAELRARPDVLLTTAGDIAHRFARTFTECSSHA
jgi:peptidoglycan/xylan/chitin deacetylase (PgdA/CDA1 family)